MTRGPYFNEIEPYAAQWLGNLFPAATIDQRSIADVTAEDLVRFDRCHFFAGIGGWELALQLAGWPADWPIDTGSCPCQPYSAAGKGEGDEDPRNLWPTWLKIIRKRRPEFLAGEQVANAISHGWLDRVFTDLEAEDYTGGAVVLGAHSIRAPHTRQRLYWLAYSRDAERRWRAPRDDRSRLSLHSADSSCVESVAQSDGLGYNGREDSTISRRPGIASEAQAGGIAGGVANAASLRRAQQRNESGRRTASTPEHSAECSRSGIGLGDSSSGGLRIDRSPLWSGGYADQSVPADGLGNANGFGVAQGDTNSSRFSEHCGPIPIQSQQPAPQLRGYLGAWDDFRVIPCKDGKARRIESGSFPLADGIPKDLAGVRARLEGMGLRPAEIKRMLRNPRSTLAMASRYRVGGLRGYGNAIVPELAAAFIGAFLETIQR